MFLQARNYIQSLAQMPKMNFANVFIGANPLGKLILFIWGLEILFCVFWILIWLLLSAYAVTFKEESYNESPNMEGERLHVADTGKL